MSVAAALRLTQFHGEPKPTLVGPAHARDGTEAGTPMGPDHRTARATAAVKPGSVRSSA